jgi:hypothetical protein
MNSQLPRDVIDVQMHPTGVSVAYPEVVLDEQLPGQLNLNYDEADALREQLNEVHYINLGVQPLSVEWHNAEAGDIIPSLGATLVDTPHVLPTVSNVEIMRGYFNGGGQIDLPAGIEITVHRRIQ